MKNVLDAEGKTLGLLRESGSRASLRRAASASKTTYVKSHYFPLYFVPIGRNMVCVKAPIQ